ncbi:hypothetical protein C172_25028 [Paenibacillus sp. FSL H8-457]|nr:hypothetical protein C172_25028 [Paenibacillus sp. FSL H8-457]
MSFILLFYGQQKKPSSQRDESLWLTWYHPISFMPCGIHLFGYDAHISRVYPSTLTGAGSGTAYDPMQGFGAQLRDHIPEAPSLPLFTSRGSLFKDAAKVLFLVIAFV